MKVKQLALIKRSGGRHWVGDGFPVRTFFSYQDTDADLSPFLLMDYAGPIDFAPTHERRGVGPHPHRGFETVTLVYAGGVSHRDSSGAGGTIGPGDVQWMTAASGVIHEEYHSADFARQGGAFEVIQLWVNLPAQDKMTAPGYQALSSAQIPTLDLPGDAGRARIIAGRYGDTPGAARTFTPVNVWDLHLKAGRSLRLDLPDGYTTALFVLRGAIRMGEDRVQAAELAVMEREGTQLAFEIIEDAVLLLLNGQPLNEPIVGHGPFVMNTQQEISQAINDYNSGQFGRIVH